jgi:hypothetical protein
MYHAFLGDRVEAKAAVRMLEASQSKTHLDPIQLAMIHHELGEDKIAMDWLETAYNERWPEIINLAVVPHMPCCSPRFGLLMRRFVRGSAVN